MPGTCTRARSHTSNCHHSPYPGAQEDTERTEQVGSGLSGKVGHKFEQMAGIGVEGKPGRTGGVLEALWRYKISLVICPDCWVLGVKKVADLGVMGMTMMTHRFNGVRETGVSRASQAGG